MWILSLEIVAISSILILALAIFFPVSTWISAVRQVPLVTFFLVGAFTSVLLTAPSQATLSVDSVDESRFVRIALLSFLSIIAWLVYSIRGFPFAKCSWSLFMTFLFSTVAMLSYFYSSNPLLSLWKGFEVFAAASVLLAIGSSLDTFDDIDATMKVIWLILLFLLLTALVGGILQPQLAFVRQFVGRGEQAYEYWGLVPRINPNSLTQFGAMVGVGGLIAILQARGIATVLSSTFVLGLGAVTIYLGHSRTSLLSFLVAVIAIFWFGRRRLLGLAIVSGSAVVAFATYTYVQAYVFRGQSKAVFLSLSGRTEIWPQVWSAFTTSPIVGHGYYAGHRLLAINDLAVVSSVDNTYLEVLVDLGIVGLVIILLSLLFSCGALYACRPSVLDSATANRWRPTWLLMVSALFLVGVRSLTGPTFQVLHPNLLIFLSIAVCGTSAIRIMSRAPDTNGDGYEMSGETP